MQLNNAIRCGVRHHPRAHLRHGVVRGDSRRLVHSAGSGQEVERLWTYNSDRAIMAVVSVGGHSTYNQAKIGGVTLLPRSSHNGRINRQISLKVTSKML